MVGGLREVALEPGVGDPRAGVLGGEQPPAPGPDHGGDRLELIGESSESGPQVPEATRPGAAHWVCDPTSDAPSFP